MTRPGAEHAALDLRPAGTTALLATYDTLDAVVAHRAALTSALPDGVVEVVSGARSLLLRFDPARTDLPRLRAALGRIRPVAVGTGSAEVVDDGPTPIEIPVVYDGEDLSAVAAHADMSVEALRAWHTGQVWTSAFCGFAPGFSYLTGTLPPLEVPRRTSARTAVPSGAVALAGEFSAVYPRSSPGGWQLIGQTETPMWSLDREPPALAPAGARVRFVDVT